jgi:hypothetical protein
MSINRLRRLFLSVCVLVLFAAPGAALAQDDDMSFDEDEGTTTKDDIKFDEDEGTDTSAPVVEKGREMAVVAIPSAVLDAEQLAKLQSTLMDSMAEVKKYSPTGPSAVLPLLEENDTDTCVKEQLCLGSVGKGASVSYILLTRVTKEDAGYRLVIDLFDVQDKLFIKSKTFEQLGSFDDVIDTVQPAVRSVFDIRNNIQDPNIGKETGRGTIQSVFAYTTAVLAVACVGGGVYYGLEASAQEDEIKNNKKGMTGRYDDLTQKDARAKLQEAQSTASTANVFYGLGLALGAASVALFVIDFGADVDESEEYGSSLQLVPSISPQSVGIGTMWRF